MKRAGALALGSLTYIVVTATLAGMVFVLHGECFADTICQQGEHRLVLGLLATIAAGYGPFIIMLSKRLSGANS